LLTAEDRKFGRLLLERGVVEERQLLDVFKYKKHHNEELAQIILHKGLANKKAVYNCLAEYLNLPFIELSDYAIDPKVIDLVPSEVAFQNQIIPVFKIENSLTIAMVNPGDVQVIDTLHRETGYKIEPAVSTEEDIREALNLYYATSSKLDSSLDEVIENIQNQRPKEEEKTSTEKLKQLSEGTPVVKLVNLIISQAILDRASDIHIEPEENTLHVRYRIDGVLHDNLSPPKHLQSAIISRIKILADMDIAESRVPQDGRFQVTVNGSVVDLRVSTLPMVYGENIVMRILDKSSLMLDLSELGFDDITMKQFKHILSCAYGIILVCGPTGSGKTTTLYSALQSINTPDKNIITIEDPVEYRLKRIRQSQVNVKAGLTFANGLRAILRQDPDIIMVGEIRDTETAKIAVESALTGHLVLSTIHTNDAPGALTRLTEMGIEPFLTASATVGVLAQRLVRKLCENCKEKYAPSTKMFSKLQLPEAFRDVTFYRGAGCDLCKNTGYKGRIGIYEIMTINEEIRDLILDNASAGSIRRAALQNGMRSLRQDGLLRVQKGLTTLEEVLRVTNAEPPEPK